jgi:hypothetical protein
VRRRATATLRGRRIRKDDPEYGVRRRLSRNREDLTEEKFADMWNRLVELGPAGERILAAWIAKEVLRAVLALARTSPSRHQISHRLWTFYWWCADTDIPEVHRFAETIQAWWAPDRGVRPHRIHQRRQRGRQPADQDPAKVYG